MVVTQREEELALNVVKENTGRHGNNINFKLQQALKCGPTRAANVLHHLVKMELVYERNSRFYAGGSA